MLALAAVASAPAYAQEVDWTRQFGTSGQDQVLGIAANRSGIYLSGVTNRAWPGYTNAGLNDVYVRKFNAGGGHVWTIQFGSAGGDLAYGIAVNSSGVYVSGTTFGTMPGQTNAGGSDVFVRKYDIDGNELWTRQFGTSSHDFGLGIAADESGIYLVGHVSGTLPGQTSTGTRDAFVRKYDSDGNEVWTRQFGASNTAEANGVAVDASGLYVTGGAYGVFPGQSTTGSFDAFVRKYDFDGNEVWTRQFGTSRFDLAHTVAADASGVYVAGFTQGALPGQTGAGSFDVFVRKFDTDGNEAWTSQFGSTGSDIARSISVAASGVYVAGYSYGVLPGQTGGGGADAFVRMYDFDGNDTWTRQIGGAAQDYGHGITADDWGVYVAGNTTGALPGKTNAGSTDGFLQRHVILTPAEAIRQLMEDVVALNLHRGIKNSLDAKLSAVLRAIDDLNDNNDAAAIRALKAFVKSVQAQSGKKIAAEDADALIAAAQAIIDLLSSP